MRSRVTKRAPFLLLLYQQIIAICFNFFCRTSITNMLFVVIQKENVPKPNIKTSNTSFNVYYTSKTNIQVLQPSKEFMFVRSDLKMIKINLKSIVYIESYSDYIKIHVDSKTIITRETISAVEAQTIQK